MNLSLTNKHRESLGLELIDPTWERVDIEQGIAYFDGDVLRKVIWTSKMSLGEDDYDEYAYNIKTLNSRTMIAPLTERGKAKRLTRANLNRITGKGMYLAVFNGCIRLANFTTQQTYFDSQFAGYPKMTETEIQAFLDRWAEETTPKDLEDIRDFANAKRKHIKYREGDFFRFRYDRRNYGYGRILFDVQEFIKSGGKFWGALMGKPLCVSVYHIVTPNPDITIDELQKIDSCPSQYIMDNRFYYGEYEIIGNAPVPEDFDCPIMYGEGKGKIIFCQGKTYWETAHRRSLPTGNYRNSAIGFGLNIDKSLVEECIRAGSNAPYWNRNLKTLSSDLRNPANAQDLHRILNHKNSGFSRLKKYLLDR